MTKDALARLHEEWETDATKNPYFDNYHFEGAGSFLNFLETRLESDRKIWLVLEYDNFERSKVVAAYESEDLARRHAAMLDSLADCEEVTVRTRLQEKANS